ncbi:MAG: VWA domain-containing protein [Acidobacteriales bacterium]|nr:VWA domain-containing protein [Terriglobales bacterium]
MIRTQVSLVNLYFNVKDKRGGLVPGLTKDDFEIYEDGVKQDIKFFSAETDLPLTLGLLMDTSGSMSGVLPLEKEVAGIFLRDFLRENKDLAFVINFDVNVELQADKTSSVRELRKALEKLRINEGGGGARSIPGVQGPLPTSLSGARGTALFDGVYLAGREILAREVGRKAMILFTDGVDNGSKTRLSEAVTAAQKSDSICYVLLITDSFYYGRSGYSGDRDMKKLSEETGGHVFDAGTRGRDLKSALDQISSELRSQYTLAYTSTNPRKDGSYRRLEVKTKAGKVQARRGYYAPVE